ncbi:sensor domain-containing diguanylate cyclase [Noviherbaspirillum galbum]|uniref:Diguanylate cyclase n=1 Tax=Noviherbaspirillum galbum TaxID=2709383 RepID=A0A6B3SPK9_9BURK|nr:diguanylate cyclase [Noviherbaspirillum galbum]NEX62571.1 diguanylate cyclase [Noviherbaspirillum galbum]
MDDESHPMRQPMPPTEPAAPSRARMALDRPVAAFLRAYMDFGRKAIPWKVAVFLLVTLPVLWGVALLEISNLRTIAEEESNRDAHNFSLAFAQEVKATVSTIDLSLIGLRANWIRNRADFRTIVNRFTPMLKDNIIFQVTIVDADGNLVFTSTDPNPPPLNLRDRDHVSVHARRSSDNLYISKPVKGRVSKKWSVQFTRPIFTLEGKFDGVIVASVEPSYFSRFYHQIDLGKNASVSLSLADGTVLARASDANNDQGMGTKLPTPPFDDASEPLSGYARYVSVVDGIERFYAWRALPAYGLIVNVGQSVDEGYARYAHQESFYLNAAIVLSVVLAGLGLALAYASRYRQQAMQALADTEIRLKLALKGSREGVWDWDLVRQTATLSERAQEILQVDSPTLSCTAEAMQESVHPEDIALINHALMAHITGHSADYSIEHRVRARDGSWIWILSRGMVTERDANGHALRMVGTFLEITERRTREESTIYLAQHDRLTRLPNRWLFSDRMHQALVRSYREQTMFGLIYFDLDKFKPVNDYHGHDVGDKLLKAVADRIKGCLRESDTIARLGGDEFAVLLARLAAKEDAMDVAAKVLRALNEPFVVDGLRLEITGSLGIATYPEDGLDEETLLRHADAAMYRAKREGRNRICQYRERAAESLSA